ncbi:V-set domain-containing T-cell activation inhibitor 1-like [Bufo gargarizans]|uniref:V-set domain-containing T-cell activation inhibitor 1-like n=1 Tax=Bufo gargarizans TaxID=30331 RepID=UPI001CF1A7EE|nr:V-set domain-containing T-cell activation inhibitor 1-like [Bufo gargarizans]XP_044144078.1 V-set domain-containing T-cell activation inhibitor 1-like [Bufo gargarizans]
MATIGQVIFRIMIAIIILLVAALGLIIGLSVAGNSTTNDVTTVNTVGQMGKDAILPCTFTPDAKKTSNVLWEKVGDTGNVYKYENGKISLTDQNSNFKTRTSLFITQLSAGNASLALTNVKLNDAGVYKCTITNSNGQGQNTLSLSVGAFSDVTVTNISQTTLRCDSTKWYPIPTVSWLNVSSGQNLNSVTNFVPSIGSMVRVISDFRNAEKNIPFRCVISNNVARAQGDAILTDYGLETESRLEVLSSARISSPSLLLLGFLILTFHLGDVNL